MNFSKELLAETEYVNRVIAKYLPAEEGFQKTVISAMNYSMKAGGKRLRPLMMYKSYPAFGGDEAVIEPFMAAMEMIHTHSLIHDDLPALDNDDYRRGRLTTHKVYGEAMGILAGDALLNYAYEVMLQAFDMTEHKERVIRAMRLISTKTGIYGMLGGQCTDVENDGRPLDEALLDFIHIHKTSALIEAPLAAGAILAGASEEQAAQMEQAGLRIGLAFQITDDILDVTGDEKTLGKPVHSDEKNGKTTYVVLKGLQKSLQTAEALLKEASDIMTASGGSTEFLCLLAESLTGRRK